MPNFVSGSTRWTVRPCPHPENAGKLEINRTDAETGRGITMVRLDRNDAMVLASLMVEVAGQLPWDSEEAGGATETPSDPNPGG